MQKDFRLSAIQGQDAAPFPVALRVTPAHQKFQFDVRNSRCSWIEDVVKSGGPGRFDAREHGKPFSW